MQKLSKRNILLFFLCSVVFYSSSAIANQYLNLNVPVNQNGDIVNQNGQKIEPKQIGGEEISDSVKIASDGIDLFTPTLSQNPYNVGINSATNGCPYWWLSGRDSYSYKFYVLYLYARFYSSSTTTYGTSTATCGEPLNVDRLYLRAVEHPVNTGYYSSFEKTGYNVSFIEAEDKRYLTPNAPWPCGVYGYHEATHHGSTWNVVNKVGCGINP